MRFSVPFQGDKFYVSKSEPHTLKLNPILRVTSFESWLGVLVYGLFLHGFGCLRLKTFTRIPWFDYVLMGRSSCMW